jgi:hypothetical protein
VARRRRLLVVLAVVALVAVVTASALAVRALVLDKGFIGLPPEGATPSAPESGELVLAADGIANADRTKVWAYADGRLISQRSFGDREPAPGSANRWSSGLLEQRLTAAGVELLRSEIVSTGLFDEDKTLIFDEGAQLKVGGQPCLSFVHVRNGAPLVDVTWHGSQCPGAEGALATAEQAETLARLVERLVDPGSWLPASAWEARETRAYVPARFSVCYSTWPSARENDPSGIFSLLPAAAADILGGKDKTRHDFSYLPPPGDRSFPATEYCSEMTIAEARALASALEDAVPAETGDAFRLTYRFDAPAGRQEGASIYFEPYLPHGETTCSACG